AYNWAATGNPLRPTQAMEIQNFLPGAPSAAAPGQQMLARVGFPPGAWLGGTAQAVQGGGLRLANLPTTLPANVAFIRKVLGDCPLGLALWGAVVALVRYRMLFFTAVPYCIVAILFFSCWPRPDADSRYLAAVHVFLPMLIVTGALGTLDLT